MKEVIDTQETTRKKKTVRSSTNHDDTHAGRVYAAGCKRRPRPWYSSTTPSRYR